MNTNDDCKKDMLEAEKNDPKKKEIETFKVERNLFEKMPITIYSCKSKTIIQ